MSGPELGVRLPVSASWSIKDTNWIYCQWTTFNPVSLFISFPLPGKYCLSYALNSTASSKYDSNPTSFQDSCPKVYKPFYTSQEFGEPCYK